MRATIMFGAGDVRIENVPDAQITEPTDVVVAVSRACICGSDLWPIEEWKRFLTAAAAWGMRRSASSKPPAMKFAL